MPDFDSSLREILRVYLIWLAFGLAEALLPARGVRPIADRLFNLGQSMVVLLVMVLALGPLIQALVAPVKAWVAPFVPISHARFGSLLGPIAAGFVYLVLYDFFYYWFHRLEHTTGWMWAMHRLHHSDTALNVTTTLRVHWIEEVFRILFLYWPLAIVTDLPPLETGAIGLLFGLWTFFIHANLRLHLGPFSMWIAGPQVHRIHHSREAQHLNRNFAAFFPVWDRLFGTWWAPARAEFPETGLADGSVDSSLMAANAYPFRQWIRSTTRSPRWLARS
jgi:sterol desaturase/sphingolipid hydroxylase (fatty acid hydroxylase superfamily)